jgi:hypothetical protein
LKGNAYRQHAPVNPGADLVYSTRVQGPYEQMPRGKPPELAKFRPKTF